MKNKKLNGFKILPEGQYHHSSIPVYVLEDHTPDDVARAMIDNGNQKQPFYIFNMEEAYRRIQHFKELMPKVKIFYAVKSNDTDMMLRLAVALGLGFDCASPGEIHKIRQLNVNPKSIVYAMPCKTTGEMEYAQKAGVKHTTFDSSCELKKLKQYWPDARLLIRIRVDGTAKKRLGEKYGCDFETEAIGLLDEAACLGLNVAGVAFHVGSICYSPESFVVGLQQARALFDHEARAGRRMTIVDIGGGFLSDRTDRIDEVSQLINDTLQELFPDPSVQVIAEPGRYLSDSAFKLYCSIIGVRQVIRSNVPVNMIYLNNGIYGTMRFDENWHKIKKYQRSSEKELDANEETILWGPTCDSIDRVMLDRQVKLPRCTPDDWLVLDIHGAYTFSFSTTFSCLEIPLIRPVVSKELWNHIKTSLVFGPSDFVLDPEISAPLLSTLPPVLPTSKIYEHSEIPTLNVSQLINDTLQELFPDPSVQVIAEPGRYLSDSAFKLYCSIIGVRQVIRSNVPVNMIYLNNGIYGTMRFDENWHKIKKYQRSSEKELDANEETILWGPTCDSIDRVMLDRQVKLPRCTPDDWLVLDIHGAYTFSFSTTFSCLEIPLIRPVVSKELWNHIKTSLVFGPSDFVLDPEISAPLLSTLPPVLPTSKIYEHSEIPTLNV